MLLPLHLNLQAGAPAIIYPGPADYISAVGYGSPVNAELGNNYVSGGTVSGLEAELGNNYVSGMAKEVKL